MTRINVGIPVAILTDEHLLAEHREIKRVCAVYAKRLTMPNGLKGLPTKMTLGQGHVLFFVNKGAFTFFRYLALYDECIARGFNVTNYKDAWQVYGDNMQEYNKEQTDVILLCNRIIERLHGSTKSTWHFHGKPITAEQAAEKLTTFKQAIIDDINNYNTGVY